MQMALWHSKRGLKEKESADHQQDFTSKCMQMRELEVCWLPAGLRDRVHADAWQMQTGGQAE